MSLASPSVVAGVDQDPDEPGPESTGFAPKALEPDPAGKQGLLTDLERRFDIAQQMECEVVDLFSHRRHQALEGRRISAASGLKIGGEQRRGGRPETSRRTL
jgi:hypothetical protein